VTETSKRLVTEVYLEGIMQKLTETGNAWMQHLLAQCVSVWTVGRVCACTSSVLCLRVENIAIKDDPACPILSVMVGGIDTCVCFCFVYFCLRYV
jgi:hypothetical protein